MLIQNHAKKILYGLMAAATLASGVGPVLGADGILLKVPAESGDYCHLKFPAIDPNTLGSRHPRLENPAGAEIIDYYGPCDHDPLGKDEVQSQMREEWERDYQDG
jgi:hypothetical protein